MKYLIMLGDGMADTKTAERNITPLEAAHKPCMDFIAANGMMGLAKTVPDHLNPPGSDIANMSVMGYDPDLYYTGRSPLEAVSMGIGMSDSDAAIRMNLVTLSDEADIRDASMLDYSAGEITTKEAAALVKAVAASLSEPGIEFYPGISYRHCLMLRDVDRLDAELTPPHDISERPVREYLPKGLLGEKLLEIMEKSRSILKEHPVNVKRARRGLNTANCVWFWGMGRKPGVPDFFEKTGLRGAVVSAVDLVKGLGKCAGMTVPEVEGATGNIDTNYAGKAQAAIDFLRNGGDLVYIHVEAPDECGHHGDFEGKTSSIEMIDKYILAPVKEALAETGSYRILLLPDHPTPIECRTHTHTPVPFVLYDSEACREGGALTPYPRRYTEDCAAATGLYVAKGCRLLDMLIK